MIFLNIYCFSPRTVIKSFPRRLSHLRCSSLKRWNRRRDETSLHNSGTSSKWGISYSVRPSYALGWRQVQRTCTDLILRMATSAQQRDYQKWGISYSVRPSYALGWRQMQRTCTDLILRIAENKIIHTETVNFTILHTCSGPISL